MHEITISTNDKPKLFSQVADLSLYLSLIGSMLNFKCLEPFLGIICVVYLPMSTVFSIRKISRIALILILALFL
jgi:hypothetical protein